MVASTTTQSPSILKLDDDVEPTQPSKIQRSVSNGLRLELGQRVQHAGRGYGTVCLVDYCLDKCYHVHYDDGEVHRYNPIQASFKFRLVEGTFAGVRLTLSAANLEAMNLTGSSDSYAVIRRLTDDVVVAKTETIRNSLDPAWRSLLVPYTDLHDNGRVRVEVNNSNRLKADQLIGAYEINLLAAVDQFDGMPLMRTENKRGELTVRIEGVRKEEIPKAVLEDATTRARREREEDEQFEKLMRSRSPRQALNLQRRSRRRSSVQESPIGSVPLVASAV